MLQNKSDMKHSRNLILFLGLAMSTVLAPSHASAGMGSKPLVQKKATKAANGPKRLGARETAKLLGNKTLVGGLQRVDSNPNGPGDHRHNFRFARKIGQVTYSLHIIRDGGQETLREHKISDPHGGYIMLDQSPDGRIQRIGANLAPPEQLAVKAMPLIKGMMAAEMKALLHPYALMIPGYQD